MALELDPGAWLGAAGGGGGLLGFVAGQVRSRSRRITKLENEVEACRKRDARLVVVEAGFRMIVGELVRRDPDNQALKMCGDLLNRKLGPAPEGVAGFEDLLRKLDEAKVGGDHDLETDDEGSR